MTTVRRAGRRHIGQSGGPRAMLAGAVVARTDALPVFATDTDRLRSAVATVCERLGDTAARAALEHGATLSDADVLARAHAALDPNRFRHR